MMTSRELDNKMKEQHYQMGSNAFTNGVKKCPTKGDNARYWWDGWLDTRTQQRLGHIFSRTNLKWPDREY